MDPLPEARRLELIEQVTKQLRAWNLREPAMVLLMLHTPLAFIGSQCLLVAQPFLGLVTGDRMARELVLLVQDPQNLEQLAARLEQNA